MMFCSLGFSWHTNASEIKRPSELTILKSKEEKLFRSLRNPEVANDLVEIYDRIQPIIENIMEDALSKNPSFQSLNKHKQIFEEKLSKEDIEKVKEIIEIRKKIKLLQK